MRDDEAQAHAGCFVFVLCVRDYAAEERGFAQTERVAADGAAVFHLRIELVLAAVQHDAPYVAQTEGEVGSSFVRRRIVGQILGVNAAEVVIAAREYHGNASLRDLTGDLVNDVKVCDVAAVVGNVAVQNQKVDLAVGARGRDGGLRVVMRVGHHEKARGTVFGNGNEIERRAHLVFQNGIIGLSLDDFARADGVAARAVQRFAGHGHAVNGAGGTQNAVGIVIVRFVSDLHPHYALGFHGNHDLVFPGDREHDGRGFRHKGSHSLS